MVLAVGGVRKGSLLNRELDLLDKAVGWVRTNQAEGIARAKALRSNPHWVNTHLPELRSWKTESPPGASGSGSPREQLTLLGTLVPPRAPWVPRPHSSAFFLCYLWGKNADGSQTVNMGFQYERNGKSWDCCPGDRERPSPIPALWVEM